MNEKRHASAPPLSLEHLLCEGIYLSSSLGFLEIPDLHLCYYSFECQNKPVTGAPETFSVLF
jgi:hypothetical protein